MSKKPSCAKNELTIGRRNQLFLENEKLIPAVIHKYRLLKKYPYYDDMYQWGAEALIKCIERWDQSKPLSSFAYPYIFGTINTRIREEGYSIKLPRALIETNVAVAKYIQEHPGCTTLGALNKLGRKENLLNVTGPQSLSEVVVPGSNSDSEITLEEMIPTTDKYFEEQDEFEVLERACKLVVFLNEKHREIFTDYIFSRYINYCLGEKRTTTTQLGQKYNMAQSNITKIVHKYKDFFCQNVRNCFYEE